MELIRENPTNEFKREYEFDIKKEVVAFANSRGGIIYVGRDNEGNSYPLDDVTGTMTKISNGVRDGIRPDVTMFVSYDTGDSSVTTSVSEGTNKLYYLTDKGLKPSGVYVRQGESAAPASFEQMSIVTMAFPVASLLTSMTTVLSLYRLAVCTHSKQLKKMRCNDSTVVGAPLAAPA